MSCSLLFPQPLDQCTIPTQISNYAKSHRFRKPDKGKGTHLQMSSGQRIRQQSGLGRQTGERRDITTQRCSTTSDSLTPSGGRNTQQGEVHYGPREDKKVTRLVQKSRKGAGGSGRTKPPITASSDSCLEAYLGSTAYFYENYFRRRRGV